MYRNSIVTYKIKSLPRIKPIIYRNLCCIYTDNCQVELNMYSSIVSYMTITKKLQKKKQTNKDIVFSHKSHYNNNGKAIKLCTFLEKLMHFCFNNTNTTKQHYLQYQRYYIACLLFRIH